MYDKESVCEFGPCKRNRKRVCDFFDDRQESKKGNCLRKGLGSASTIAQACTKVLKRNLKKKNLRF